MSLFSSAAFLDRVANPGAFLPLFDVIPEVCLFVKDRAHRYMKVNRGELLMHGCASEDEIVGKTDFDFNPPALAAQYVEEDKRVMQSRRPLLDQIWLVQHADGLPQWYLCNKFPLFDRNDTVVGIAGVMWPCNRAGSAPSDYKRMNPVYDYVLAHYGEPITLEALARRAHLSPSQLTRQFRKLFRMTPIDYVLRVRLLMARRRLSQSHDALGTIALECGFYDQSHFTRAFRASTGLTPREFRRRFAANA